MTEEKTPRFYERTCDSCGKTWLSALSTCPQCGRIAKSNTEEMTKKVVDDNDLRKAF